MSIITRRPYHGETDLDAIANLINTCEIVDQLEEGTSVTELKQSFDDPSIDKQRDLFLWQDDDNQLIVSRNLSQNPNFQTVSLWVTAKEKKMLRRM